MLVARKVKFAFSASEMALYTGMVEGVHTDSTKEQYPFSRRRVLLSGIIAVLSTVFAFALLWFDLIWVLYFVLATAVFTIATFLLKKRIYVRLVREDSQSNGDEDTLPSWLTILVTLLMLIAFIAVPMLLAGFLSGALWFIMITSFTSGVSISEIILYMQTR